MYSNDNYGLCVEALRRFNGKFKPQTSTDMKTVTAALFLAQNDRVFKYANIIGLLQLDMDRKLKTKFLRIYNMDSMKLAFQIELYYDFISNYSKQDDKFYYFPIPKIGTVGLLFKSKQQADAMYIKLKAESPSKKQCQQIISEIKAKQKKQQQSHSFFGALKKKLFKNQQVIEQKSQVLDFKKVYTTQIDKDGNFVQTGTSPIELDIMQRLKLTQKQRKDPQILNMIATDLLIHQIKKQAIQPQNSPQTQKLAIQVLKQHEKQQKQYIQQCRMTVQLHLPPPPPPPPILSPMNRISNANNNRGNLLQQIRNNNLKLKHVKTNQKGGVNIDLSKMDTQQRDDFATALRKKIALRKKALNPHPQEDQD